MLKSINTFLDRHPNIETVTQLGLGSAIILTLALTPKGDWRTNNDKTSVSDRRSTTSPEFERLSSGQKIILASDH